MKTALMMIGYEFGEKASLVRHEKYQCDQCPASFKMKYLIKSNVQGHKAYKTEKCTLCTHTTKR